MAPLKTSYNLFLEAIQLLSRCVVLVNLVSQQEFAVMINQLSIELQRYRERQTIVLPSIKKASKHSNVGVPINVERHSA